MAIIDNYPRMATARALNKVTVAVISEESLAKALRENLVIVETLIKQLIGRLRQLYQKYESERESALA